MPNNYKEKLENKRSQLAESYLLETKDRKNLETYTIYCNGMSDLIEQTIKLAEALSFYNEMNEDGDMDLADYSEKITEDGGDTARETLKSFNSWLEGK